MDCEEPDAPSGGCPSGACRTVGKGVNYLRKTVVKKEHAYHLDPEILGGTLVFKGTRVPVQSFFDHLL